MNNKTAIEIYPARIEQSATIARLVMMAMTDECCLHFCGEGATIDDFHTMMTLLVEREDSQYSYCNTLVAMDGDSVVGALVCYDGGKLRELRQQFVRYALEYLHRDHSNLDDETQAGELYIDSLAVDPAYRGRGIATHLLNASLERARQMGLPGVGLLVDKGNPNAERLYLSCGFRYVDDNQWGGHAMRHLVRPVE